MGVCFVVDEDTTLLGLLTDGDLRRGLLKHFQLEDMISTMMNTSFISLPVETDNQIILENLNERVKIIPLVNEKNQIVDYATVNKIRRIPIANPLLKGNELAYVTECIKTAWISSQGKFVKLFEKTFCDLIGHPKALAVSNGTVAIHLALEALGIKEGDEVIVPDLTFAATINAVLYCGATPVLVDVEPNTWNISGKQIESKITSKTKAIVLVHLYGNPCDIRPISDLAKRNNIWIVEDCAEALGSIYYGKHVGYFSDAATFSFFGNKTVTTGEGGMVTFKDPSIGDYASTLRDHGMSKETKYWHNTIGFNYRMTNLQAAIGVAQMERFDEIVDQKHKIAALYNNELINIAGITLQKVESWAMSSYWMYTFLLGEESGTNRQRIMRHFNSCGIETRPTFYPLHQMPPYKRYSDHKTFPHSERISSTGISLPSSLDLDSEVVERIVSALKDALANNIVHD
jgi:perosamine synthetase